MASVGFLIGRALMIESTVSYPLDHQENDAGKSNFLVIIF